MPCRVREVLEKLADVRGSTAEVIARTVEANFARLIQDDPRLGGHRALWQ